MSETPEKKPFSIINGMTTAAVSVMHSMTNATIGTAARIGLISLDYWADWFSQASESMTQNLIDGWEMNPSYVFVERSIDEIFEQWYNKKLQQRDRLPADHWIHSYDKYSLIDELEFLPRTVRTATKMMIRYNPHMRGIMEREGIAGVLRAVSVYDRSSGELHKPEYNKQFLNESADGSVHAVTPEAIRDLFVREAKDFPRIIITTSHARAESLEDMKCITHGIEAMARDASDGTPLPLASMADHPKPGQTVILFACDTERTMGLNAAKLIDRHTKLKYLARTGEKDTFEHISPAAKRIAKVILQCMAENPEDVTRNDPDDPDNIASLSEIGKTIRLRPQAARIAQHIQLIGYSKGGNVVSDAMRYLVTEMLSKDENGNDLVIVRRDNDHLLPVTKLYGERGVKSIVRNIGCMALAAREEAMSDEMLENGIHRVSANNRNDRVAFDNHYEDRPKDENYSVVGVTAGFGHGPEEAMGTREGASGYFMKNPRFRRRMMEFVAPHHGKASIGGIDFVSDYEGVKPFVRIKTTQGTTDEVFAQHKDTMLKALLKAGLKNVHLESVGANSRQFLLHAYHDFFNDPKSVEKLNKAFVALREGAPGLVIRQRILDVDLPNQLKAANENQPKTHVARAQAGDRGRGGRAA
jgi:hypothetical protein